MKYYSEELNKVFDTAEELNTAEAEKHKAEEEMNRKNALASKEKKELANAIEKADEELDEAYKQLDLAREKAKEIQREALKKVEETLHPAEEAVKAALDRRYKCVKEFNDKYGVFTTTLTGAKAAEEMSRVWKTFDNFLDDFFR